MPDETKPRRFPTVAAVRAMLAEFPDDMPVAILRDESCTYEQVVPERRLLRWTRWTAHWYAWVDAWDHDHNGTETEHVIL